MCTAHAADHELAHKRLVAQVEKETRILGMLPRLTPGACKHTDEEPYVREVLRRDVATVTWDTRYTSECLVDVLSAAAACALRTDNQAAERQQRRCDLRAAEQILDASLQRSRSDEAAAEAAIARSKALGSRVEALISVAMGNRDRSDIEFDRD